VGVLHQAFTIRTPWLSLYLMASVRVPLPRKHIRRLQHGAIFFPQEGVSVIAVHGNHRLVIKELFHNSVSFALTCVACFKEIGASANIFAATKPMCNASKNYVRT